MVQRPARHDESELAEAIRSGARRRSEQAFGEYYQGRHASCALGTAYDGLYRLPEEVGQLHPKRLDRLWKCLEGTIRTCPVGCRKRLILAAMSIHLNDDHRWDRERIAAWVAGSGQREPKPESSTPR